jgi:hypothetical protein
MLPSWAQLPPYGLGMVLFKSEINDFRIQREPFQGKKKITGYVYFITPESDVGYDIIVLVVNCGKQSLVHLSFGLHIGSECEIRRIVVSFPSMSIFGVTKTAVFIPAHDCAL